MIQISNAKTVSVYPCAHDIYGREVLWGWKFEQSKCGYRERTAWVYCQQLSIYWIHGHEHPLSLLFNNLLYAFNNNSFIYDSELSRLHIFNPDLL